MFAAVTISLVPEAQGGPFVFWGPLAQACEQASRLGFEAVEIFPRSPEDLSPQQLNPLLERFRLKVAAVGTGAGWVVQKLRLSDPDPATRARALEFAAEIVDAAAQFGSPAIIGSMQGKWETPSGREQAQTWIADALQKLSRRAADQGTHLLLEPLNRYETNLFNTVDDTITFLERFRLPNVKILCDLFHMNIEEEDIGAALRRGAHRVGHVHFADSNRRAIGLGHTDIAPVQAALHEIDYTACISAEILPLPDSVTAAKMTLQSFHRWFAHAGNSVKHSSHAQDPTDPS